MAVIVTRAAKGSLLSNNELDNNFINLNNELNNKVNITDIIAVNKGGTGVTSLSALKIALDLVIGTDVQAYNETLTNIASLSSNGIIVKTGINSVTTRNIASSNGDITITNPDGINGNINLAVGSNIVKHTELNASSGASGIGILDSDNNFTSSTKNVETITQELAKNLMKVNDEEISLSYFLTNSEIASLKVGAAINVTTKLQNAINTIASRVRGGVLTIPDWNYTLSSTINVLPKVKLRGSSKLGNRFIVSGNYGDVFYCSSGNSSTAEEICLENLNIYRDTSSTPASSGNFINFYDVSAGVINNVNMKGYYNGITIQGCEDITVNSVKGYSLASQGGNRGISIIKAAGRAIVTPNNVTLNTVNISGANLNAAAIGLYISSGKKVSVNNSYFGNSSNHCVMISQDGDNSNIENVVFDSKTTIEGAVNHCVSFAGALGDGSAYISNIKFEGTTISGKAGASLYGVYFDDIVRLGLYPITFRNVKFDGVVINQCKAAGAKILSGDSIFLNNSIIHGNNFNNSTSESNVEIGTFVSNFTAIGGRWGGNSDFSGVGLTRYGVKIKNGASNIVMRDVNLLDNFDSGLSDESTPNPLSLPTKYKQIQGCLGFNNVGFAVQPTFPASNVNFYNVYGRDFQVWIVGGTVSNIQINNVNVSQSTDKVIYVPANKPIKIIYSSQPTWVWVAI